MPAARRAAGSDETALRKPFQGERESVTSPNDDRYEKHIWKAWAHAVVCTLCGRSRFCELMSPERHHRSRPFG